MSETSETTPTAPVFLTVAEFCKRHTWAKVGGIRHAIFFARDNGLEASGALIFFGRKLLIDEAKFIAWVREHGTARGSLKHGTRGTSAA